MVGVLGLGSNTTLHFIKRLNEVYQEKHGGYSTCPFVLLNSNFDTINPFLPNNFTILLPVIQMNLNKLREMGCREIVVPNMTIHEAIDKLDVEWQSSIIHPFKLLHSAMQKSTKKKALILGTRYTMQHEYLRSFLQGLEFIELSDLKLSKIDAIRKSVYEFGPSNQLRTELMECIQSELDSTTALIVACTELSLLVKHSDDCIDILELQIQATVSRIL